MDGIAKLGEKICTLYENIVYRENLKVSRFKKFIGYQVNLEFKI